MRRIFTKNTATVPSNATATGLSVLACECAHCLCCGRGSRRVRFRQLAIDDILACARVYVHMHTPTHSRTLLHPG